MLVFKIDSKRSGKYTSTKISCQEKKPYNCTTVIGEIRPIRVPEGARVL